MGNHVVTNVYVKINYQQLRIDKTLGNFLKSDNNNNHKVCSAWGPFLGPRIVDNEATKSRHVAIQAMCWK